MENFQPQLHKNKNIQFSEDAPDTEVKLSKPVDIGKLRLGMESFHGSLENDEDDDEIPKPLPKFTRGFSENARPPTPPNARHLVRKPSPPRTPQNTPAQF